MMLFERDPFGFHRAVYHPGSGTFATGIRPLLRQASLAPGRVDRPAIAGYLSGRRLPGRTVLQDMLAVPPGHALRRSYDGLHVTALSCAARHGDLEALLLASLQSVIDSGRRIAVALSGGLDSALLLALMRTLGARDIPAYILAADMPGYGEREAALATARRVGVETVVANVGETDFVAALPEAMRHIDEPLYNLHPVAKLLLARAMRRDGIEVAISGDGADQVLSRDRSADYLPLCGSLFDAAGVTLAPPFLDTAVVAHLLALPPDPDKHGLRALGARHNLATDLVHGPKQSRLAPTIDLGALVAPGAISTLAKSIGMPGPSLRTDAERVHWTTLRLLLDDLRAVA